MRLLLFVLVYLAVWVGYGRRLSVYLIEKEYRVTLATYGKERAKMFRANFRDLHIATGFGVALFWPVTMPARGLWRVMTAGSLITPSEKQEAREAELIALRRLAREHNLPMPEEGKP